MENKWKKELEYLRNNGCKEDPYTVTTIINTTMTHNYGTLQMNYSNNCRPGLRVSETYPNVDWQCAVLSVGNTVAKDPNENILGYIHSTFH